MRLVGQWLIVLYVTTVATIFYLIRFSCETCHVFNLLSKAFQFPQSFTIQQKAAIG